MYQRGKITSTTTVWNDLEGFLIGFIYHNYLAYGKSYQFLLSLEYLEEKLGSLKSWKKGKNLGLNPKEGQANKDPRLEPWIWGALVFFVFFGGRTVSLVLATAYVTRETLGLP